MKGGARLVSVVIPVFNCQRYLAQAIESVLGQTYRPIEVVVVDDGSTDGSAGVVRQFAPPVRYCHQPHGGIGAARNRGVELARGGFMAFLDADDLWAEDKLSRQMAALEEDPPADIVFGRVLQFISPELAEDERSTLSCPEQAVPGFLPGTMLTERENLGRVGPFDTALRVGEFIDWYARALALGLKMLVLPDVVLYRRLHLANQGTRERAARLDYVRVVKASLDRRRAHKQDRGEV